MLKQESSQQTEGKDWGIKKVLANYSTNQGLIFKIYRDQKITQHLMSSDSI